ncbi:DUF1810 domain-containing protein [Aeromicrobium sp. IC_218]|uniref:DUF1810 domain-containing protein n=1 Tax=Aeromicrobium sp. IC_218 TaxID=2545468 RepID=UPI00103CD708|nr:DUF1810 domain-containing protein [Aeromicrobium sp. IC_218]TCI98897.1 DUF1810 domain-containing protein [Aeromicrobium sp. IC_218]
MTDSFDLQRFVDAQGRDVHDRVVAELTEGRKRTHWMWFVFPQMAGLGRSETSMRFAISSPEEAEAYLAHPVLGPRLVEVTIIVRDLDRAPEDVLGPVDAQKLHSSMTLFARTAADEPVFGQVLERWYAGCPDAATDRLLSLA